MLIALCSVVNAQLFSLVNRYQISFDVLDSIYSTIHDSTTDKFIALPNAYIAPPAHSFASLLIGEQRLSLNVRGLLFENLKNDSWQGNYFAAMHIEYQSPHLGGVIEYDLHSSNRFLKTTIADSMSDLDIEQVVTGYDHISGSGSKDFNFSQGYLKFDWKPLSVLIGKTKLRWGPGYKGTLGMSGTTFSPFYFYYLQLAMGRVINFSCFLNGFDDDFLFPDTLNTTDNLRERYGAGQRIDVRIGKHVQVGLYEFVDFHGSKYLSRFANPLQIYYFGNVSGGSQGNGDPEGEMNTNILGGFDLSVIYPHWRAYLDFLNDDITVFTDDYAPNKFAYQIGAIIYPSNAGWIKEVGIEYTHISYGVYTHRYPGLNRHVYFSDPRGWPWGNDQDLWNMHIRTSLPHNLMVYGEANLAVKGQGTMDEYHWDMSGPALAALDLKHTGNFVDYSNDPKIISFLLNPEWRPWKFGGMGLQYRPSFGSVKSTHELRAYLTVDLPGDFVFPIQKAD